MLAALRISLDAFRVAGGILLLLQANDLRPSLGPVFAHRARTARGDGAREIAIFPLAFPVIAGPAGLTAIVLLMGQSAGDPAGSMIMLAAMLLCLLLT